MEEQKKQDMRIPANVQPIYADEANVNANVKINVEKDQEGNETPRKTGKVEVLFFDQFSRSIVSRVIVDPFTAKSLGKILISNADRLTQEMESNEIPDQVKQQMEQQEEKTEEVAASYNTYIG